MFPFGQPSLPRPPRRPVGAAAQLIVVGVCPSALHVKWSPPAWAVIELGIGPVAAMAVDDEPCVFWDGSGAADLVEQWRHDVAFREGDDRDEWGWVTAAGNGTSGRSVVKRVLGPLSIDPAAVWFTDVVDRYFVKSGRNPRQQAEAMAAEYEPFARLAGLPSVDLPARPSADELVALALEEHADRLRNEIAEAHSPTLVTLGDEARRVLLELGHGDGPPTVALHLPNFAGDDLATYGGPGQRSPAWTRLHDHWLSRMDAADDDRVRRGVETASRSRYGAHAMTEIWLDAALDEWEAREHPDDELRNTVLDFIAALTPTVVARDWVRYAADENRFEARVPQTRVFVEVYVFCEIGQIEVIEIAAGG